MVVALAFLKVVLIGMLLLVGRPMYIKLASKSASVIVARVATVFFINRILLLKFGQWRRQKSKFANYSPAVFLQQ